MSIIRKTPQKHNFNWRISQELGMVNCDFPAILPNGLFRTQWTSPDCYISELHLRLLLQQNVQTEDGSSSPRPETPGTETEGDVEVGLLDVDLDSYQTTLEEVLTWLLSAEDTLQIQEEVSNDVEDVKEQFHTHEVRGRQDG